MCCAFVLYFQNVCRYVPGLCWWTAAEREDRARKFQNISAGTGALETDRQQALRQLLTVDWIVRMFQNVITVVQGRLVNLFVISLYRQKPRGAPGLNNT